MVESSSTGSFEFVKKFSYRDYQGGRTNRFRRIFSLATFEMTNTWKKSTIGKIILGLVVFFNILIAFLMVPSQAAEMSQLPTSDHRSYVLQTIFKTCIDYLSVSSSSPILPSNQLLVSFSSNIGFLIIALLAIAGSGFFADDKEGKVIEIYLSRMRREDYALGKVLGMFLYCNLFITIPFLIISILQVQGLGQNHFDYLNVYASLIMAGAMISAVFTIFTLLLSSFVEKRAYASLSFFIGYILFDSLAQGFYASDPSNELLLLAVPSYVIALLIYSLGGNWTLGIRPGGIFGSGPIQTLSLNDGIGLESWQPVILVSVVLLVGLALLLFKIHRLTTNEL